MSRDGGSRPSCSPSYFSPRSTGFQVNLCMKKGFWFDDLILVYPRYFICEMTEVPRLKQSIWDKYWLPTGGSFHSPIFKSDGAWISLTCALGLTPQGLQGKAAGFQAPGWLITPKKVSAKRHRLNNLNPRPVDVQLPCCLERILWYVPREWLGWILSTPFLAWPCQRDAF